MFINAHLSICNSRRMGHTTPRARAILIPLAGQHRPINTLHAMDHRHHQFHHRRTNLACILPTACLPIQPLAIGLQVAHLSRDLDRQWLIADGRPVLMKV